MNDNGRAVATVLLVLQAGLGLLAAAGLLVFARTSNAIGALAGAETLAFGGPLVLLLLAIGAARNWRMARLGIYIWEGSSLLGAGFAVLASAGTSLSLTNELTGIVLPLAIIILVRRRSPITFDLHKGLIAGLLMLTGLIHLGLVADHMTDPPRLGPLFALDGAAFVILALASLKYRWWRWPAAALLVLTILAYLIVLIRGLEGVDDLGVATKLVELVAFGLVVWPHPRSGGQLSWRLAMPTASFLLAIGVSGTVAWAATLRPGAPGHHHDGRVVLTAVNPAERSGTWAPPTDAQRLAAVKLAEDTRAGIARFTDVQVALAEGYRPGTPATGPTVHYDNPAYHHNGQVVDPEHPQALVYANTSSGLMLLGAMYMMPNANSVPPDIGGSLTEWHTHPNLCFLPPKFAFDGLESPYGTCPVGSINGPTPPMLHVWTVALPGGPFGDEPSPAVIARFASH